MYLSAIMLVLGLCIERMQFHVRAFWLCNTQAVTCLHSYTTGYYPETLITDIQCDNLSMPANGNASCSSGRVEVGYKGDTCIFTCNTGYELTGSDTRTCQSDRSWSGNDTMCSRGN